MSLARCAVSQPGCRLRAPALRQSSNRARRLQVQSGQVRELNEEDLELALVEREKPMVIDFYADWCGPCVLLADELVKVAEELGDEVSVFKVNTEVNTTLSSQLQIQGLPTMIFVGTDPEKPALRTEGLLPAKSIIEILRKDVIGTPSEQPGAAA